MELKLYTINTEYVEYLQKVCNLSNVLDNKEDSVHGRRYLGTVLMVNGYKYYVPLSSPKNNDYMYVDGERKIRKSIIPIMRIVAPGENGEQELKGKLKFSSMIPVPDNVITYYNIAKESELNYKMIVEKEYAFIKSNQDKIIRNAQVLYRQKTRENILYKDSDKKPGYLAATVDFKYAEKMHDKYIQDLK